MKKFYKITILSLFLFWGAVDLYGQTRFVVKTNLLYGGYARTPNLGVEVGFAPRWSFDLSGAYNPFNLQGIRQNNRKLVHWVGAPEFRYWTNQCFTSHFLGLHGLYGCYNIGGYNFPLLFGSNSRDFRYEGQVLGGGFSYGYDFLLGGHWNLELTLGIGVLLLDYDSYERSKCGVLVEPNMRILYFGPTKAGITLLYHIF